MMKKDFVSINIILLIVLAVVWGSSYILMKRGLDSFSALQVSMLRIIFACIALLPFLKKAVGNVKKSDLKYALFVAILGSGIPSYLFPLAIQNIDSSVAGIINALTPLFTMLFAWAFFKFKPTFLKLFGLVVALIGASFLMLQNGVNGFEVNQFMFYAIAATACYGLSSNILKSKLNDINATEITSLTFAMIGPVALIVLLQTDFIHIISTNPEAVKSMIYIAILGVMGTAAALVLFNLLIKRTDAVYATSVTFLIPIIAMVWGFLDGEIIGYKHFIGMFFILLGVYLTTRIKVANN